jgi:hypothetical protein
MDVTVIRKQRTDARQWHVLVIRAVVPGQYQLAKSRKQRVTQNISYGALNRQLTALTSRLRACLADVHEQTEKQDGYTFGQ